MNLKIQDIVIVPAKIVIIIFALFMIGNLFTPLGAAFNSWKGSNALNCPGYVDSVYGGAFSYNASYDNGLTAQMVCPAVNMSPSFIIFFILISLIIFAIPSSMGGQEPTQQQY